MQTCALASHPAFPPLKVASVEARWGHLGSWLLLRWRVEGADQVVLPPFAGSVRQDGLWQTTCFEVFVHPHQDGPAYAEFNFSPSEAYAAYDFAGWRRAMSNRRMNRAPVITPRRGRGLLIMDVALALADLPALPAALSLTCVIEEQGGVKSYWAMDHGKSPQPDFHQPSCFVVTLAAPQDNEMRH